MQDKANPLATILSAAMLLKYGLGEENAAKRIEAAVLDTLNKGFRTGDIYSAGTVCTFFISHFFVCFSLWLENMIPQNIAMLFSFVKNKRSYGMYSIN